MTSSYRRITTLALFVLVCGLLLSTGTALAQNFVYANNDAQPNSISGWMITSEGGLQVIPGSPFLTGGNGGNGGYFASHRVTVIGNYLYASNAADNTISAFSIDPVAGGLTTVTGSPFPYSGQGGETGISLAPARGGKYLVAAATGALTSYQVSNSGALIQQNTLSVADSPDGLALQLSGNYGAYANADGSVQTFSIAADGTLALGASLPASSGFGAADVIFNSAGDHLYAVTEGAVYIWTVDSSGNFASVVGFSPLTTEDGSAGQSLALSADGNFLFSGSPNYGDVGSFSVLADSTVSEVPGSPWSVVPSTSPTQLAVTTDGKYVFVGAWGTNLNLFSNSSGSLTQVATTDNSAVGTSAMSVAAYPSFAVNANAATTTTVSAPAVTWPGPAAATVQVTSASATPTGSVTLDTVPPGLVPELPATLSLDGTGTAYFSNLNNLNAVSYTLQASYSQQSTFAASTGSATLVVNPEVPTVDVTGGPFQYDGLSHAATVTVTPAGVPCDLSVTYNGSATLPVSAGPYTVAATCSSADSNWAVGYGSGTLTIKKAALTATANNTSVGFGAWPNLTGTLTGVAAGDGITASYATTATLSSQPAQYPITPVLSDPNTKLANYTVALNNGTLTISQDQTTTTLQASATSILLQNSVTFTAQVAQTSVVPDVRNATKVLRPMTPSRAAPSGSVTFYEGGTAIGTATLDNTGAATLTLSTLTVGTHSITAVYAGSVDFVGSSSAAVSETVQDFNFTVSSGMATTLSATVLPGGTAVYTMQVAPTAGTTFDGNVVLTLAGLPAGATYTIVPSTIAMGSGTTTVTVRVISPKPQATAAVSSPGNQNRFPGPLMLAFCLPLFGLGKLRRSLRLQIKTPALMMILLAVLTVAGMTACGSGSGFLTQTPQTYPMTLTGTSGALHHSVTLDLTVQ
jgi:6-phosphogluconolactonase (cycloisomerase 2 family)